jgi:hypothetical protein
MTVCSFASFADASTFAKRMAKEHKADVRLVRCANGFIVEGTFPTDAQAHVETERFPLSDKTYPDDSALSSDAGASDQGVKSRATRSPSRRPRNKPKKGLSAAAAKRMSSQKQETNYNPRSIFITDSVKIKVLSGGLPSLGKRK